MSQLQVYFETLQVQQNGILVWLHHPARMLVCDLKYLQSRQVQSIANPTEEKNFIIYPAGFTEYRKLDPPSDSKMPILIQCHANESLTTPWPGVNNAADHFVLSHEEMTRILNTTRSILNIM